MRLQVVPKETFLTTSGGHVAVAAVLENNDNPADVMASLMESPAAIKMALAEAGKSGIGSPGLNMPAVEYPIPVNDKFESMIDEEKMVSFGRPYAYLTKIRIRSGFMS